MERHKWSNEEIAEYRKQHEGRFYFNKRDANMFVPKASGLGTAVNWASPEAWVLVIVLVVAVVFAFFFVK
jgi:uncharacterized membrane protein